MFHLCFHMDCLLGIATVSSITARLSTGPNKPMGALCHTESMELVLEQEGAQTYSGFGIVLGCQKDAEGINPSVDGRTGHPLIIAQIERGSPADKCGVLQPGDRITAINDWQTENGILEEAQHLLRACSLSPSRSVTLLVEFTVIEPILPPSPGILFCVRLAKRGSSLGIECKRPTTKGEPLVISEIRMGSVAHRCGSLSVGDHIYSVDSISTDALHPDEAIRLLKRSAPVVKLCIAKGGGEEQDFLDTSNHQRIVYSIQLSRRGQPLGMTLASGGADHDPIIITHLAPGGLAERCGICVDDQLLSINEMSMEGLKVSQTCHLLATCPDPLNIKLCRRLDSPLKSIVDIDSLEASPHNGKQFRYRSIKYAHLRHSTSNNFQHSDEISGGSGQNGWDSGFSTAATDSQPEGGKSESHHPGCRMNAMDGQERCCGCRDEQPCSSTSISTSPQSSASGGKASEEKNSKEEWVRILEALETVGEEEMLRKLEECIISGQASNYASTAGSKSKNPPLLSLSSESGGVLSRRFLPNSSINNNNASISNYATITHCPNPVPSTSRFITSDQYAKPFPSPLNGKISSDEIDAGSISRQSIPWAEKSRAISSQPGTPVLSGKRLPGLLANNNNSFELPPPMPSPRSAGPTNGPLSILPQFQTRSGNIGRLDPSPLAHSPPHNSSTFISSSSSPPLHHHRSSSTIPFITTPIVGEDGESEKGDQFDELADVFSVVLHRCPMTKSYGFSVCDGVVEGVGISDDGNGEEQKRPKQGIFIRSITKEGPADRSGKLDQGDQIISINGRTVEFLNCDFALPLLANNDRVELLLRRRRKKHI